MHLVAGILSRRRRQPIKRRRAQNIDVRQVYIPVWVYVIYITAQLDSCGDHSNPKPLYHIEVPQSHLPIHYSFFIDLPSNMIQRAVHKDPYSIIYVKNHILLLTHHANFIYR